MKKQINFLYIHVPFCKHLCNYCDFYKNILKPDDNSQFTEYFRMLEKNIQKILLLHEEYGYYFGDLKTIYLGGGTPSLLKLAGIENILNLLDKYNIKIALNCEFTLEANPGTIDKKMLIGFKKLGINRLSLGIQSLDSVYLKTLDRVHGIEDSLQMLESVSCIFDNFSCDLMIGLPQINGHRRNLKKEMQLLNSFNPTHISFYILTVKNKYVHYQHLPDDKILESEYLQVCDFFKTKGFVHYEVSNIAKTKKHISKHNMAYWKSLSVSAIGPSATGFLSGQNLRYKWNPNMLSFKEEQLTEPQIKLESFYLQIRTNSGIIIKDYFTSKESLEQILPLITSWQEKGLAEFDGTKLILSSKGFLIQDFLIGEIFTYVKQF